MNLPYDYDALRGRVAVVAGATRGAGRERTTSRAARFRAFGVASLRRPRDRYAGAGSKSRVLESTVGEFR